MNKSGSGPDSAEFVVVLPITLILKRWLKLVEPLNRDEIAVFPTKAPPENSIMVSSDKLYKLEGGVWREVGGDMTEIPTTPKRQHVAWKAEIVPLTKFSTLDLKTF